MVLRILSAVAALPLLLLTACSLPPTILITHGAAAAYAVTSYTAFGDSITYGAGLAHGDTEAYPALVAADRGWTLDNRALPGQRACDVFPYQISSRGTGTVPAANAAYSLLIGTNDADNGGAGGYEAVFKQCHAAVVTWLATRTQDKTFPGSGSVTASGACTNRAGDENFLCSGPGTLSFNQFASTGNALYVWYTIADGVPAAASFTVTADGTTTTALIKPAVPIDTGNGTTASIGLLRIAPFSAASRSVQISTATGGLAILAVGTNRAIKPIPVAVGNVPNQRLGNPIAPVSTQLAYSLRIRENIADAVADGLDVRFADDRSYMLGTGDQLFDQLHPNLIGQQFLSYAFLAALP